MLKENRNSEQTRIALRAAFRASLPVMAGYVVLGIGFGILMHSHGYGFMWSGLMSLIVYAGSMQYAAIDLISAGAGLLTTALMTIMINGRHFFYGLSMLGRYRDTGRRKPYLIFALTDETYALVCAGAPEGVDEARYDFYVSLIDHGWWLLGSVLGGLIGSVLPFSGAGIDFSMTALFVVIAIEQWESTTDHRPVLIGIGVSALLCIVLGASRFIIPAMVVITLILALIGGKEGAHG